MFVMERLIDLAARRHGFDRVALRRRNLVPPGAMPYTNPFGIVYDSGDYPDAQDRVLALADWAGFEARRAEARRRGRYRGIGLANYIEIATGAPRERAQVTVRPDGFVDVIIGTLSAGQGHETAFAQLIAGVARRRAGPRTSDRGRHRPGRGGRRLTLRPLHAPGRRGDGQGLGPPRGAGRPARRVAARVGGWRTWSSRTGASRCAAPNRAADLFAVAAAALRADAPADLRGPLEGECDETVSTPSFPYGSAVCEVEVDHGDRRGRDRALQQRGRRGGAPSTR